MIENEKQLRITKAQIRQFQAAIREHAFDDSPGIDPNVRKAAIEAMESEVEVLRQQVWEFERGLR